METGSNYENLLEPKRKGIGADTVILCFLAVILLLLFMLVMNCSLCLVDGDSMNNTLVDKQYVLLQKGQDARVGDIVVFYKDTTEKNYIKRVVAVGGETIRFTVNDDGDMILTKKSGDNFVEMTENYIKESMDITSSVINKEITVPAGSYYVMGDNRNHSSDSRDNLVGVVSKSEVKGKVMHILAPGGMDEWLLKLVFSAGIKGS